MSTLVFMAEKRTKALPPDQNEAARRFTQEIIERDFPLSDARAANAKIKGNVQKAAEAFGVSQSMLYEFLDGKRGAGMKLLDGIAAYSGAGFEVILGREAAPTDSGSREDLDPYSRVRARSDFQALPRWAQTYWASQVQSFTGSRQTDRVKEARLLEELDAIIKDIALGELTEANAVNDPGVPPTPPPIEAPPPLPLAKGLDEHGRPTKKTKK